MVRLRKSHRKLRITLFSIFGAIIATIGALAIYMFVQDIGENEEPTNKSNTKLAVSSGVTPSSVMGDEEEEGNTLFYLAYVLDTQEAYSANAVSSSTSMGIKSNTDTYKDYQDGVMVATDITYGSTSLTPKSATQTCYAYDNDGTLVAYRRTASGSVSSDSTPENLTWSDTLYYYYRDEYLGIYGEYSTEMTVYLINEETIDSYTSITDNGDGTYSQTFTLNSKAGWYYQNAMMTNGGLESAVFNSIVLTVTFDDSWQVLKVYTEEETSVKMKSLGLNSDTSATVTTTFLYGEEEIYSGNYDYYTSYFVEAIPTALPGAEDTSSSSVQITDLLASAFADVLSKDGDQFAFTLNMGENTYYGIIYLQMDASNIAVDTITARLIISADENYTTQDLYIEFAKGEVNVYYSKDFAMNVGINDLSDVINDFSDWVNASFTSSSSSDSSASSSSGFSLESLLEGLDMDDSTEGKLVMTLDISDLFGFGLYAEVNFDVTEADGETVYTLVDAVVKDITYNGTELDLYLTLEHTETDISTIYDESQTPFDLAQAAESIYALLEGESLQLDLDIDGESLAAMLSGIAGEYSDYLDILSNYDIYLDAQVDIDGVLAAANLRIEQGNSTVIDLDVYYEYSLTSTASPYYGLAYIRVNTFMGVDCTSVKAYCDIAELYSGITQIISLVQSEAGISLTDEEGEEADSLATIINSILGMNFGSLIKEVKAGEKILAVTLDADYLISLFVPGLGIELGDIYLEYIYTTTDGTADDGTITTTANGGELYLNLDGIGVTLTGSTDKVSKPSDSADYLDLTEAVNSVYELLASDVLELTLTASGESIVNIVNSATSSQYADYLAILNDYNIDITALVSLDGVVSADIKIYSTDVTVIEGNIYYAYDGTSTYGTAYLTITQFMNVDCSVKAYCDIAELATSVTKLITLLEGDTGATIAEEETGSTSLSTADIIKVVLGLDYSKIINGITINSTNGIQADVNIDSILETFISGITLNLGDIVLGYTYDTDEQGNTLAGELSLTLDGISATLSASAETLTVPDSSEYLDLTATVDSVYGLLESGVVALELTVDGSAVASIVNSAVSGYEDYLAILEDYVITVNADVSLDGVVSGEVVIERTTDHMTVLNADIYYAYDGTSTYGTAYIRVTKFMDVQCAVAVYCDIAELVTSIDKLIDLLSTETGVAVAAEEEAGSTGYSIVDIIKVVLGLDYSKIINEITIDSTNGIQASISVDSILEEFLGVTINLGSVNLVYTYTEGSGVLTLGLTGISATLKASDSTPVEPDSSKYVDLTEAVNSVYELLASDVLELTLTASGESIVNIVNSATNSQYASYLAILNDYSIDVTALVSLDGIVSADIKIYSADVTVIAGNIYYAYDGTSTYGTAYLTITQFMNVDCSVKVYCDIAELATSITDLITLLEGDTGATIAEEEGGSSSLSTVDIIKAVLALDYTQIINNIDINKEEGASKIYARLVIDSILEEFLGVTINLGSIELDYTYTEGSGTLSLGLSGIEGALYASTQTTIAEPSGNYVDLNNLVTAISNAATVAYDIAENGASFEIKGAVDVNESAISIDGKGEVVLETSTVTNSESETVTTTTLKSVAVDVTLAITNGIYNSESNSISLQVVYLADNYKSGATDPFLYVVINKQGIAITYDQFASFTSEVSSLYNVISALLGSDTSSGSSSGSSGGSSATVSNESILTILQYIMGVFADDDIMAKIDSVASLINNFTITVDENGAISLTYSDEENALTLNIAEITTADGKLTLVSDIADLSASISAYDGTTNLANSLVTSFAEYSMGNNLDSMVYLIYGYVFECLDDINISAIFGSSAYSLELNLDGDNSGISALAGVTVNATATAGTIDSKNIYTIEAQMDISGFAVDVSMVYYNSTIYVEITDIGGTQFTDLKVKASADDIYSLVENVVELILNENVLSLVSSMVTTDTTDTETGTEEGIATVAEEAENGETSSTLTAVFELLTAILKGSILSVNADGDQIIVLDIDSMLSPFGITAGVGSLTVDKVYTDETVTGIKAAMTTESGSEWLTLTANSGTAKYTTVDTTTTAAGIVETTFYAGSYVDIGFAAQLVEDIATFALDGIQKDDTTGGVTGVEYTFTGTIDITAVSIVNITLSDIVLTVGYGSEGIYLNMSAYMSTDTSVVALLGVSMDSYNIGITYYNNLLTLARDVGGDSEIYYVMTFDYFIDYLFSTDSDGYDSPLRWLTNCSGWSTVTGLLGAFLDLDSISSGLKDTSELFLYEITKATEENVISIFSDYITSFAAVFANGTYSYGDYSGMESQLGLSLDTYSNGYYAIELASSLTSGILSTLYVAITRDATYGLGSILAYASIDSYVTIEVDLAYSPDTTAADNYYTIATESITDGNVVDGEAYGNTTPNTGESYIFGAAKIESGSVNYLDSLTLADVYVYVREADGTIIGEDVVKYGSVVYTYSLTEPIYAEDGENIIAYSTEVNGAANESYILNDEICEYDSLTNTWTANFYKVEVPVHTVNVNYILISNDGTQTDSGRYVILQGSAFSTTLSYDGYTLVNVYTDEDCTQVYEYTTDALDADLTLYAKFAKTEETFNGVTYTFVQGSTGYSYYYNKTLYTIEIDSVKANGGYYVITGYDGSYSGDWLVLESNINGYDVVAIGGEVFSMDGITYDYMPANIVVPETVEFVWARAFYKNTSIQNVIFLAKTVYFSNDTTATADGTETGRTRYAFYGCSSTLTVYYTNVIAIGEEENGVIASSADNSGNWNYIFAYNWNTNIFGSYTSADNIGYTTAWTYYSDISVISPDGLGYETEDMESVVAEILQKYSYNTALYAVNGAYFYTTSLDISAAIEEVVLANINAYTAEYEDYINGYSVAVTVKDYAIIVTITETGNAYYAVTVASYLYNDTDYVSWTLKYSDYSTTTDGVEITYTDGTNSVVVSYAGTVEVYDRTLYALGDVTITANNSGYTLDGSSCENYAVTLKWSVVTFDYPVTIYSDVAFTLDTTSVAAGSETTIELGTDSTTLDSFTVTAPTGYYFLGWAYDNEGTLTFTSDITTTTETTYYAIWGYSSVGDATISSESEDSNAFEGYLLELSGYTFYGWWNYANDSWVQVTSLTSLSTENSLVVEAVWLSDLTVTTTITGSSSSGTIWKTYTYSVTTTISGGVLTGAFADSATVSVYYAYCPKNNTNLLTYDNSEIVATNEYDYYEASNSTSATASSTGSKSNMHTYVKVTYTYGGTTIDTEVANYISI